MNEEMKNVSFEIKLPVLTGEVSDELICHELICQLKRAIELELATFKAGTGMTAKGSVMVKVTETRWL